MSGVRLNLEERISTEELKPLFNRVIELSKCQDSPGVLYSFIAKEFKLSKDSICNYSKQKADTAPRAIHEYLESLVKRLEEGLAIKQKSKTVKTAELGLLFNKILELSKWQDHPYILYKFIESETGTNRITVYKYHTQKIKTAPKKFQDYLVRLRKKLEENKLVIAGDAGLQNRVSTKELEPLFDNILALSRNQHCPGVVYGFIAGDYGLSKVSVSNYASLETETAPLAFQKYLEGLVKRLEGGLVIGEKIKTSYLKPLFDDLFESPRWQNHPFALYAFIEEKTGIDRIRLYKYHTQKIKVAPRKVEDYLVRLKKRLEKEKGRYVGLNEILNAYKMVLSNYNIPENEIDLLNQKIAINCRISKNKLKDIFKANAKKKVEARVLFAFLKYLVYGQVDRSQTKYYKKNYFVRDHFLKGIGRRIGYVEKSTSSDYTVKYFGGPEKTYIQMPFNGGRLADQHLDFSTFPDDKLGK